MISGEKMNKIDRKSFWKNKNVFVTGAGGFIGSHLCESLVELGATVTALIHYNALSNQGWLSSSNHKKNISIIMGDVTDYNSFKSGINGIDIVFHLAALIAIPYSYRSPESYINTNVKGTYNILQACIDNEVKHLIHTSSSEVFGSAQIIPIDEDHALNSQSPYAATKIAADMLSISFHKSFQVPVSILRPFNTYGPRQSSRAIIPTLILQALTSDHISVGNLSPTRDLNYVSDTVNGFLSVAENKSTVGQFINIGSGTEISIKNLAEKILSLMGKNIPITQNSERFRPSQSEVDRLCADSTKAQTLMGWKPEIDLDTGIAKTIEWFENNLDKYNFDSYVI